MDLNTALQAFKEFHGILNQEIDLEFKYDNGGLFVKYNEKWIQLNYKNNPTKFRLKSSLGTKFSNNFMLELIPTPLVPYPTGDFPSLENDLSCQWITASGKKCTKTRGFKNLFCWNHNNYVNNGGKIPRSILLPNFAYN